MDSFFIVPNTEIYNKKLLWNLLWNTDYLHMKPNSPQLFFWSWQDQLIRLCSFGPVSCIYAVSSVCHEQTGVNDLSILLVHGLIFAVVCQFAPGMIVPICGKVDSVQKIRSVIILAVLQHIFRKYIRELFVDKIKQFWYLNLGIGIREQVYCSLGCIEHSRFLFCIYAV